MRGLDHVQDTFEQDMALGIIKMRRCGICLRPLLDSEVLRHTAGHTEPIQSGQLYHWPSGASIHNYRSRCFIKGCLMQNLTEDCKWYQHFLLDHQPDELEPYQISQYMLREEYQVRKQGLLDSLPQGRATVPKNLMSWVSLNEIDRAL